MERGARPTKETELRPQEAGFADGVPDYVAQCEQELNALFREDVKRHAVVHHTEPGENPLCLRDDVSQAFKAAKYRHLCHRRIGRLKGALAGVEAVVGCVFGVACQNLTWSSPYEVGFLILLGLVAVLVAVALARL